MLSNVLRTPRAVQVNIAIMRAFARADECAGSSVRPCLRQMSFAVARPRAQEYNEDEHADYNGEVRQVEYPGMKRPGPDHHEVGNEPVVNEPVNEIADAAGPD